MTSAPGPDPGRPSRLARPSASSTTRERWTRLRQYLWRPPRAHGEQPRRRVVGPLELFCDLAVVVLVWIAWANGSLHAIPL